MSDMSEEGASATVLRKFASFHQGNDMFSPDTRRHQCVCNAFMFLLLSNFSSCVNWTSHDINHVLINGDMLYADLISSNRSTQDHYLMTNEHPQQVVLNVI